MIELNKTDMNLALGVFSATAVLAGPIAAMIATAAFVAGLLLR